MKFNRQFLFVATLAVAAFAHDAANGQTLNAVLQSRTPGFNVSGTVDATPYKTYVSAVLNFSGDYSFQAFCVEPLENLVELEPIVYQVQPLGTLDNSDQIARLVGRFLSSDQSALQAAAVQWAIWEMTNETSPTLSVNSGVVQINPALHPTTRALTEDYLGNIGSYAPASITYLTSGVRQDVITWDAVPEPGVCGLLALSSFAFLRRRRR